MLSGNCAASFLILFKWPAFDQISKESQSFFNRFNIKVSYATPKELIVIRFIKSFCALLFE